MQDVQTANEQALENNSSPDSLFGVCQAISDDFGFNPLVLRLGFLAIGFFSIPASIGAYALLGIGVATSRWLFPKPESQVETLSSQVQPATAELEREPELLAA
jgi:phage shock protein PspC (stress-responsive transcriptional regulator)